MTTLEDEGFDAWNKQTGSFLDKYGYYSFQIIGALGIVISLFASFYGGFRLVPGYVMIFFISMLFFIGGVRWAQSETPSKQELDDLYAHERMERYETKNEISDSVHERRILIRK
ncbi:MAG: hypothetical protein ACMXYC_01285 [Candidatus Woesearchaeota archaeon]